MTGKRRTLEPMDIIYVFSAVVWCPLISGPRHISKIGITGNVRRRAKQIALHSPVKCILSFCVTVWSEADARRIERLLHRKHGNERSHGEWFFLTADQASDSIAQAISMQLGGE